MAKKLTHDASANSLTGRLLKRLPGGNFVKEQLDRVEQLALGELKQRLDRLERNPSVSVVAVSVSTPPRQSEAPGELLRKLQAQSADQSREDATDAFYVAVLRDLVPDQVRMLAALSDGTGYPVLHVLAAPKLGLSGVPLLEYVSNLGRAAGVLAPELTAAYLRRMAQWGLVETAPEDTAQRVNYEILETDDGVRKLVARIEKSGERSRIVRRSVRISDLGLALWHRCQLDDGAA